MLSFVFCFWLIFKFIIKSIQEKDNKIVLWAPPRIASLNNFMKQRHKKSGRRGRAPQIMYTDRPDNPWRDRYLICEDCERLANYEEKPPRPSCNNSTVLELDMTAPFSRDNCMVTSCEIVQMIKEDVWVLKDEDGKLAPSPHKREPAFPVQVPSVFFLVACLFMT